MIELVTLPPAFGMRNYAERVQESIGVWGRK